MKLRCFIAMPFDRMDTDKMYDHTYKKVLKELKIIPVRIDRKQHNNDIDKEIITELKKCDLIISDLTYARPSVYFEAGFGVGYSSSKTDIEKPVIYTCRNDHKTRKKEDEHGNFTIHFDLQMKNIIFWKDEKDREFIKKLKNRIKYVISPLEKEQIDNNKDNNKTQSFSHLALQTKIPRIFNSGLTQIPKNKFQSVILSNQGEFTVRRREVNEKINILYPFSGFTNNSLVPTWIGSKIEKNVKKTIYFHTTQSLTKSQLDYLHYTLLKKPSYDIYPKHKGKSIKKFEEFLIIACFNSINPKNILNYLQTFSFNKKVEIYNWKGTQLVPNKLPKEWKTFFQIGFSDHSKYGVGFKYDPKHNEKSDKYTKSGNFLRYDKKGKTSELIRLKAIERTVKIKIIDSIKHEDHFKQEFVDFLQLIKSDKI